MWECQSLKASVQAAVRLTTEWLQQTVSWYLHWHCSSQWWSSPHLSSCFWSAQLHCCPQQRVSRLTFIHHAFWLFYFILYESFKLISQQLSLCVTAGRPKRMHLRCECIKTHSEPAIPIEKIQSLRVIPAGPQCKNEEIMWVWNLAKQHFKYRHIMCTTLKTFFIIASSKKLKSLGYHS